MDKADLETYQVQLSQVEFALQTDSENEQLLSLRSELGQLISLAQEAIAQAELVASSSRNGVTRKSASATPAFTWSAGDECVAKYSGDGNWYPARVISVGGSTENPVYSIVFRGYNNTELVKGSEIKSLPANYQEKAPAAANKRKLTKTEEEEREKKKKKNEKKLEAKAAKAKEQMVKQVQWQKFAKKAEKKGVQIAGMSGTSIFKTPDNPLGRVGVTGSGQGMTEVKLMGKHKFSQMDDGTDR
ncbi:hypothetical protein SCLCIDRAFT_109030 [Scleroderma citrinum Foug A]|uniref:Tudor domain-containing protein n=1 Tax=Scleroderma citrinum Foug A TaxID=1036808 RepID=A0A0C3EG21_9AGAM|nr:hypothetical protein SCLCIDRAFT_109030 [Scleroderma citrinum Foug A]